MALVKGTNCGFVTIAPSSDPVGDGTEPVDGYSWAFKADTPANATKVTEIGWWCDNATEAADFEVGIYAHDAGDDEPGALLISSSVAKGTTAGWKKKTGLNLSVDPSTTYWIAFQVDATATATDTDYTTDAGESRDWVNSTTNLPSPWGDSNASLGRLFAVYAVVETSSDEGTQDNVCYVY